MCLEPMTVLHRDRPDLIPPWGNRGTKSFLEQILPSIPDAPLGMQKRGIAFHGHGTRASNCSPLIVDLETAFTFRSHELTPHTPHRLHTRLAALQHPARITPLDSFPKTRNSKNVIFGLRTRANRIIVTAQARHLKAFRDHCEE